MYSTQTGGESRPRSSTHNLNAFQAVELGLDENATRETYHPNARVPYPPRPKRTRAVCPCPFRGLGSARPTGKCGNAHHSIQCRLKGDEKKP